jgi:LAO/AO transport system kinase
MEQNEQINLLIDQALADNRRAIARLMTFIEQDEKLASYIIKKMHPHTGKAYIIGITGSPGAGKSTLTNAMVELYLAEGKKVGIIMVDPSSPFSGGALLGDRIRLKMNFNHKNLFIRSMANRGNLGGLALATKDVIKVLDAAGFDIIIIETVGVGQSEVDIFRAANTTIVIVVPTLGDEIQAIKAGIMEITDIFVVNKKDLPGADKKVLELEAMLDMGESIKINNTSHSVEFLRKGGWRPPIIKTNAKNGENIQELIQAIENHKKYLLDNQILEQRLKIRYRNEVMTIIKNELMKKLDSYLSGTNAEQILNNIIDRTKDPYSVAEELLKNKVKIDL